MLRMTDAELSDSSLRRRKVAESREEPAIKPKPSKYRNTPIGGFDSKAEAKRHAELVLLERAGQITDLATQVPFEVVPKQPGERGVSYIADFLYWKNGEVVVEDVKSPASKTPAYVIKRKLLLLVHGIRITEVMGK